MEMNDEDEEELTWKSIAASVVEQSTEAAIQQEADQVVGQHEQLHHHQQQQHQPHHHQQLELHQHDPRTHDTVVVDDAFSKLDELTVSYTAAEVLEPHQPNATTDQESRQVLQLHQQQHNQQEPPSNYPETQHVVHAPQGTAIASTTGIEVTHVHSSSSTSSSSISSFARARTTTHSRRIKRKNFSKRLQLLCLSKYAEFAKQNGKIPDKKHCQMLLEQCYQTFLKEDGNDFDHPRLTYQDFLKLIRNRRREMNVRTRKQKLGDLESMKLTPAKERLQQDQARINELISIIDQIREQSSASAAASAQDTTVGTTTTTTTATSINASANILSMTTSAPSTPTINTNATTTSASTDVNMSMSMNVNVNVNVNPPHDDSLATSPSVDVAVAAAAAAAEAQVQAQAVAAANAVEAPSALIDLPATTTSPTPSPRLASASPLVAQPVTPTTVSEPMDQVKLILSIQQETMQIQQEILRRLANLRNHPSLQQDDDVNGPHGQQPSSASV